MRQGTSLRSENQGLNLPISTGVEDRVEAGAQRDEGADSAAHCDVAGIGFEEAEALAAAQRERDISHRVELARSQILVAGMGTRGEF